MGKLKRGNDFYFFCSRRSDGGKLGTKKQYQRVLHESYQFLCKFISDQGPPPGLNSNSDPSSSSSGGISGMRRRGAMAAANAKK